MKLLKFLLLLLIALVVTTNVFAADNSKKKEQKLNLSMLSLELKASKTEFLLLEPISLSVKLKDNLGEPIADNAKPKVSSEDVVINCSFTNDQDKEEKLKLPELTDSLASVIFLKQFQRQKNFGNITWLADGQIYSQRLENINFNLLSITKKKD